LKPVLRVSNDHGCQDLVALGDLEEFIQGAPFVESRRDESEGTGAKPHGVGRQDAVREVDECIVGVGSEAMWAWKVSNALLWLILYLALGVPHLFIQLLVELRSRGKSNWELMDRRTQFQ
jgi:hypothetical protein